MSPSSGTPVGHRPVLGASVAALLGAQVGGWRSVVSQPGAEVGGWWSVASQVGGHRVATGSVLLSRVSLPKISAVKKVGVAVDLAEAACAAVMADRWRCM